MPCVFKEEPCVLWKEPCMPWTDFCMIVKTSREAPHLYSHAQSTHPPHLPGATRPLRMRFVYILTCCTPIFTATHCNTPQHTATHTPISWRIFWQANLTWCLYSDKQISFDAVALLLEAYILSLYSAQPIFCLAYILPIAYIFWLAAHLYSHTLILPIFSHPSITCIHPPYQPVTSSKSSATVTRDIYLYSRILPTYILTPYICLYSHTLPTSYLQPLPRAARPQRIRHTYILRSYTPIFSHPSSACVLSP